MMTKFILRQHQNHFNNNISVVGVVGSEGALHVQLVHQVCSPRSDYSGRCAPKKTAMFAIHEDGYTFGEESHVVNSVQDKSM